MFFLFLIVLTYVISSYVVGAILFVHEWRLHTPELRPFGIILLALSPLTAPSGVMFYYRRYKDKQKKLSDTQ